MKSKVRYVLVAFVLASMLLGACAGAPATGASKVEAASVAYTGTIDSINGNQWIVNGQAITVDPAVIRDGPFKIGDTVKVEVNVNQDGTITVTRIEVPSSTDLSSLPSLGNDNSNVNSNDDNSNGNINDNANDDNSNANTNGNSNSSGSNGNGDNSNGNSNEVFGTVQAMTSTSITIDGQTYDLSGSEIKGTIQVGDFVKLHFSKNADGTFSVRELELSDQSQVGNSNGNDDNGGSVNSNSNNGNDDNSNGSGSGNDNSSGSNTNDNNSNGGNSNSDDNSNGGGNGNGGNSNG
jgi:hypothetical protein